MSNDLNRRAVLGSGLLVGAGLWVAPRAEASPEAAVEGEPAEPLAQLLADEDELLREPMFFTPAAPVLGFERNALLGRTLATALWTGHVLSAEPEVLPRSELARHVRGRLRSMADAVYVHALRLEEMTDDEHLALDRRLASETLSIDETRGFFVRQADVRVPARGLRAYERAWNETIWRLRSQGSKAVAQDLVAQMDRAAARHAFDWRAEARTAHTRAFVRAPAPPSEPEMSFESKYGNLEIAVLMEEAHRKSAAGARMLGIGGALLAVGILGAPLIFPLFGPPTAGIVLLITGAVALGKGGRLRRLAVEKGQALLPAEETPLPPDDLDIPVQH